MNLLGPRILAYLKLGYFHKELEIDWASLKSGGVFRPEQPHRAREMGRRRAGYPLSCLLHSPMSSGLHLQ